MSGHRGASGPGPGPGPDGLDLADPSQRDPAQQGPSRRTLRRAGLIALGTVAVVLGVALGGPDAGELPLAPRSSAPEGLLGLVRLLEEVGVDVAVSDRVPRDTDVRVLVPAEQLPTTRREQLRRFAGEGGTVVIAGPSSGVHGLELRSPSILSTIGRTERAPDCGVLDELGAVFHAEWASFEVPEAATGCFPVGDDGAWLVVQPTGRGTILALGSAAPFTNALLDEADNAVLAATLLGPRSGDRLVVMPRGEVGEGDTPLLELVPDGFLRSLWLLGAALIAAVLWRARRLGHPVEERLPPVLPSAELARSVAGLLQRAGDRDAAAGRIREDARGRVRHALGVPVVMPSGHLVGLVADRSAVSEADARCVLLDAPVGSDAELTELAAAAARLRTDLRRSAGPLDPPGESTPVVHPSSERTDP